MIKNGFAFIEVLVVCSIIGIMSAISIPIYYNYIEKTRAAQGFAALIPYKQSIGSCFMKVGNFEHCDEGKNGIPDSVGVANNINGLKAVSVVNGIINAEFSAYNNKNGENITISFFPYINKNNSNISWLANCSSGADEYFDFCE